MIYRSAPTVTLMLRTVNGIRNEHITLHVSLIWSVIRCLKLFFTVKYCASVFIVPSFYMWFLPCIS
jgi:hypothetical protein